MAALAISGTMLHYAARFSQRSAISDPAPVQSEQTAVSALGYLQPEGDVIHLSAPASATGLGSRVAKLLVDEGEWVEAGDIIAVLDNYETLQASVKQAEQSVAVAKAHLAQVQAGAKTGELEAQKAAIAQLQADLEGQLSAQNQTLARLEAELANARTEYDRYQLLFQEGAITASQRESRYLEMINAQEQRDNAQVNLDRLKATYQEQINAAQATLNQIAEVRPTDVQAANAQVESSLADVAKAKANLDLASVRAPISGQILDIYSRPGEMIGDQGIAAIGHTEQMNVIAEVYELDVDDIQIGQTATVTSNAFPADLQGEVVQIGSQVNAQNTLSTDPVADIDRRVIEIKIRLQPSDSQRVSSFTNLQVSVVIDTN